VYGSTESAITRSTANRHSTAEKQLSVMFLFEFTDGNARYPYGFRADSFWVAIELAQQLTAANDWAIYGYRSWRVERE